MCRAGNARAGLTDRPLRNVTLMCIPGNAYLYDVRSGRSMSGPTIMRRASGYAHLPDMPRVGKSLCGAAGFAVLIVGPGLAPAEPLIQHNRTAGKKAAGPRPAAPRRKTAQPPWLPFGGSQGGTIKNKPLLFCGNVLY